MRTKLNSIRINIAFIIGVCILISCNTELTKNEQSLYLEGLEITVPSDWKKIPLQGIDSYIEGILTDKKDTIIVSFGQKTVNFNDVAWLIPYEMKAHFDSIGFEYDEKAIFTKNKNLEERQGTYLEEYYFYDSIDGKKAKFMMPKKIGLGSIGIHFYDVDGKGNQVSLYAHDLDTTEHFEAYKAFTSIKFK